jgi:hypothetical protein
MDKELLEKIALIIQYQKNEEAHKPEPARVFIDVPEIDWDEEEDQRKNG